MTANVSVFATRFGTRFFYTITNAQNAIVAAGSGYKDELEATDEAIVALEKAENAPAPRRF